MVDRRLKELKEAINRFKLVVEHAKKTKEKIGKRAEKTGK